MRATRSRLRATNCASSSRAAPIALIRPLYTFHRSAYRRWRRCVQPVPHVRWRYHSREPAELDRTTFDQALAFSSMKSVDRIPDRSIGLICVEDGHPDSGKMRLPIGVHSRTAPRIPIIYCSSGVRSPRRRRAASAIVTDIYLAHRVSVRLTSRPSEISILWLESSWRTTADVSTSLRCAQHDKRFCDCW